MNLEEWIGKPYHRPSDTYKYLSGTGGYVYELYRHYYWGDRQVVNTGWLSYHQAYTLKSLYLGVILL